MIFLYIVLAILALFILKYFSLFLKRILFVIKLKRRNITDLHLTKSFFTSLFVQNSKPDITFNFQDKRFTVCLITTPFKRSKYHFVDNTYMDIVVERKIILMLNPRVPSPSATTELGYIRKRYPLHFDFSDDVNTISYVIPLPAPNIISYAQGAKTDILYNGDTLFENLKICGAKYFLEDIILKNNSK